MAAGKATASTQTASTQTASTQTASTRLKITQVRSTIGTRWRQQESLRTLGLRRIRQSVIRDDNPQTRGLIATVRHLVEVEPAAAASGGGSKK